jgi:aminoglycoside N3'-acetyltransferase
MVGIVMLGATRDRGFSIPDRFDHPSATDGGAPGAVASESRHKRFDIMSNDITTALMRDLRALGVAEGDLLMVHASMRAVGRDANDLLDALARAVGPTGTLLVNVGARDDWNWVNARPEAERAALLADAERFDALTTPADPDNGVLAEVFRTRAGTRVSDHPDGRFAAAGPLARELLADVPWDDYYGPGSPLERFVEHRGRVLRLGADPDTVTLIHYAEHLVPIGGKRRVRRHHALADGSVAAVDTLDDSDGIVDHPGEDYFITILRGYLAAGAAATGRVGEAKSELIDGRALVAYAVDWLATNLRP